MRSISHEVLRLLNVLLIYLTILSFDSAGNSIRLKMTVSSPLHEHFQNISCKPSSTVAYCKLRCRDLVL